MSWVLDFNNAPWILSCAHTASIDIQYVFRANDGKRHQTTKFGILFHGILIVLLDVVGKVVDGDSVVLNIFHNQLLRLGQLGRGQRISLADDRNDIDAGREAFHKLDIEFSEAVAGGCDEVEESVDTVVAEAGISLDSRLLCKDIIVLSLEVANDLAERRLVVNLIAEAGGIDDGERDARPLFIKLEFCIASDRSSLS